MSKGQWYVVQVDEKEIDSQGFDTEKEAQDFLANNVDYLESNGESVDSFEVQFVLDSEIGEVTL